jgi:hypothetical protein
MSVNAQILEILILTRYNEQHQLVTFAPLQKEDEHRVEYPQQQYFSMIPMVVLLLC